MTMEYIRDEAYKIAQSGKKGVLVVVPTAARILCSDVRKMSSVKHCVKIAQEGNEPIHTTLDAGLYFSFVKVEKLREWNMAVRFATEASKVDTVELMVL